MVEYIAGGLVLGSVAAPAAVGHPLAAASDSVGEAGYQAYIPFVQLLVLGVHALGTGAEGDVVLFRCDQSGIKAPIQKILNYCGCDFTRVFVFLKNAYFFRYKIQLSLVFSLLIYQRYK